MSESLFLSSLNDMPKKFAQFSLLRRLYTLQFLPLFLLAVSLLIFSSCSDPQQGEEFSFERQPQGFRAAVEEGESGQVWVLRWEPPADIELLVAYHLWAVLADEEGEVAKFIDRQTGFENDLNPSSLPAGIKLWTLPVANATSDEISWEIPSSIKEEVDRSGLSTVRWLLWAEYSSGRMGNRISTRVYYRDVFPPEPVVATVETYVDSAQVRWRRPFDLSDHLNPSQSGIIYGYRLLLVARNNTLLSGVKFSPLSGFEKGDLLPNKTIIPLDGEPLTSEQITSWPARPDSVSLVLLDGERFDAEQYENNELGITIRGLQPLHEYVLRIIPYDSLGILRDLDDNPAEVRLVEFKTTDNSKPRFSGPFTIVRTSTPGLYSLSFNEALDAENKIVRYLFERVDRDTVENFSDTLRWAMEADELLKSGKVMTAPLDFLVPGVEISLSIRAVDASGYRSDPVDTVFSVPSTLSLVCPAGMVAVAGRKVGEDFCIERFEHRDTARFVTEVRWNEARQSCRDLSDGSWSVDLCSEEEWISVCKEGTERLWGVLNYQEELLPQQLLQECYVGSGDSTSSLSISKRSLRCTTGEGVRDLPGHYQEWVVGPLQDSLRIKGGSWMRAAGADQSTIQSLASCVSYSKGIWVRPKFVLRSTHDTLFVLGDSTRFSLNRKDSLLMRRVTDTLFWTPGDSVQPYAIYASSAATQPLGSDTLRHYPTKPGWVEAHSNGLDYRAVGKPLPAFFLGERKIDPGLLYQHRTVGFRCCAKPLP